MKCLMCDYQWCWICGLSTNNFLHTMNGNTMCNFMHMLLLKREKMNPYRLNWFLFPLFILFVVIFSPLICYFYLVQQ